MAGSANGDDPGAGSRWRWDVALSFAGAQRNYVERVATALMARGLRCFYDADEQIELWGKYLAEELPAIYGEQAATVVVFVSADYATRDWIRLERRAALNRAVKERREYVLPARFDDTPLPGLLADMVAVDLRTMTPEQFAAKLATKLGTFLSLPALDTADVQKPSRQQSPRQDRWLTWTRPPAEPIRTVPTVDPVTPAGRAPRPVVWQVPARNPHFVGRAELLDQLRQRLRSGEQTLIVQALYGLGGVGKTQLAIEYAHRFAADYQLVWWIDAEQPALIATQLATLAGPLGLPTGHPVAEAVGLVLAELRRRPDWLLILDNAQRPQDLAAYQPGGTGHVLVTSRQPGWGALGGRLEVDVLTRPETVVLLRRRLSDLNEQLADQLAGELGDLPLAAAQAAGYLEQTGLPPADYLHRFRTRRHTLLARGDVLGYQDRLDTTWALSLDRLAQDSPAAVQLLQLAAFLSPEPIPLRWFTTHAALLAEPLHTAVADPDDLDDLVGLIVGYSLARRHADRVQLHRLVQAAIRHRLPPAEQQLEQEQVLALLAAAHPGDPDDPATWDAYAELAPHVLAISQLGDLRPASRQLILDTVHYLYVEGDSQASRAVADELLTRWRRLFGADHPSTLSVAAALTLALAGLGEAEEARRLGQDTLERCRRVHGPDHPSTLSVAAALTAALAELGEAEEARRLGQDTLERCLRTLGPDHPSTLWVAAALTLALAGLGEAEEARRLGQDTLERCRRLLGPDHPTTLVAAAALTAALAELGEAEEARRLGQDTLERCRRTLGPDHLNTLWVAAALTLALAGLGEAEEARRLGQDTLERCRRVHGLDLAGINRGLGRRRSQGKRRVAATTTNYCGRGDSGVQPHLGP